MRKDAPKMVEHGYAIEQPHVMSMAWIVEIAEPSSERGGVDG